MELSKAYEPQKYEDDIYQKWEESGFFNPDVCVKKGVADKNAKPFTIVLPPPNVTGTLHIGHASMLAIEDLMIRYHRMRGDRTLWLPGTDHAAIATQTKVEKLLMEKGVKEPKKELGRENFLDEVNKFAQASHDTIINQSKKIGSSLDWSREAFTLDEDRNLAVRAIFKKMFDDSLIYRGYRIVNWCPRCHSTLADDEVEHKQQTAKLYTFKYSNDFPFAIATTRPETKLGDTAVAVNPNDERYKEYIGKEYNVKSFAGGVDLKIKIVAEESVDPAFGTGALGVTPAHSHVDYEMAQKNNLPVIKIIDEDGKMAVNAGGEYAGMTVKEARAKVVENLRAAGVLEKEEDIPNNLSVCYRCGAAIEPIPSRQWFVSVNKKFTLPISKINGIEAGEQVTLKELMQKAVKGGQVKIIPDRFEKIYFHWIDNLRDWCISRQIWYGHRIPVWYKGDETYVGVEAPDGDGWTQDPDTLDTWFSSGLWTFSTLGWPNETSDLKNFHPTSVLETGYDILFFWVARMILMTAYALGDIPFEKVYLHGLVRDEQGRKMSKSLGNVIDPLDTIGKYGADATRLSLVLGNTPGNDLKLSEEKVAGFRNFANKLWNMARFMLLNIESPTPDISEPESKTLADRWILSRLNQVVKEATAGIEKYSFSYSGEQLRDFTWSEVADWYLEIAKIEGDKSDILNYILNTLLKLWHPFMPFVTEAIWQSTYRDNNMLMVSKWPLMNGETSEDALADFAVFQNIITGIRSLRTENKIEPVKKLNVLISAGSKKELAESSSNIIKTLARLENLKIEQKATKPANHLGFIVSGIEVFVDMAGVVDLEKEKIRLEKELSDTEKYISSLESKLNNADFVNRAPASVIEKEKQKLQEAKEKMEKIDNQLKQLK